MTTQWAIDLGTTNTVVAVAEEGSVRVVHVPDLGRTLPNEQSPLIPSALHLTEAERPVPLLLPPPGAAWASGTRHEGGAVGEGGGAPVRGVGGGGGGVRGGGPPPRRGPHAAEGAAPRSPGAGPREGGGAPFPLLLPQGDGAGADRPAPP